MFRPSCEELRVKLASLKQLQADFEAVCAEALVTNDLESARALSQELQRQIIGLEKELGTDWQDKFGAQYEFQNVVWGQLGILRKFESGKDGLIGIDGKEYELPSFDQIAERLEAKRELVEKKMEQGFTRLLVVPFGAKIADLIAKYEGVLRDHHTRGKLFATKKDPTNPDQSLELDNNKPVWVWEGYDNADGEGKLVYHPIAFDEENYGCRTKAGILAENEAAGWSLILVEDNLNIPRKNAGKTVGDRRQLEAGKKPLEYLSIFINPNNPEHGQYAGESGLTPEEWLAQAIIYLEETNQVIDDFRGNGSVNYNLGGWFPGTNCVSRAYWNRLRAYLAADHPGERSDFYGVRTGVRI